MSFYGIVIVVSALCFQSPGSDAAEQALRTIKGLTDRHRENLVDACAEAVVPGVAPDLYHEELALRVSMLYDDSATMARGLASERGLVAAFHMHKYAAQFRLQAYACNPLRQHLERAADYITEARGLLDGSSVPPAAREELQKLSEDVIATLAAHDERLKVETVPFMSTKPDKAALPFLSTEQPGPPGPSASPSSHLESAAQGKVPAGASRSSTARGSLVGSKAGRAALAVSGSLTGLFLGASLGMGLSRVREPFEGRAHRAIFDAARDSWSGGKNVPYGEGVDMCQEGRDLDDGGVIRACEHFDRLGRATIATGILAGVSLATTIAFAIRIAGKRSGRLRVAAAWQTGGMMLNFSGRF